MKVAITGGTAGIGLGLAKLFEIEGHNVIALSRRTGHNIRSIPKIAGIVEPYDIFINNAQVGFAQTELLFEVWRRWEGQKKTIINISTQMTYCPDVAPKREWDEYLIQKKSLEAAQHLLENRNSQPKQILIRPGAIATQPGQEPPFYKNVDEYALETYQWILKNI
jgi:nucleoside-diphosphate-sugar epimerase